MESLVGQTYSFVSTIIIGLTASFVYDYYRVVRRVFRLRKMGTFLGDIIFWIFTTALVFVMLLYSNWGELRLYVFIGFGLGALIYFRIFSPAVNRAIGVKFYLLFKLWEITVRFFHLLLTVFLFPFRLFILVLSFPINFLLRILTFSKIKIKVIFYNIMGRRIERGIAKLRGLAFWKKTG